VSLRDADLQLLGRQLGRYTIRRCLGAGGMGAVFAAHDRELDREVAIKLLHDPAVLSRSSDRLRREATAMARISDPAVVHVYEIGLVDGQAFVAMELIDGMNLREWCKQEPRSWRQVVDVMLVVGRGLVAAHGAGLVHRDVKPDNVLIGSSGRVCVGDFGLAMAFADPAQAGVEAAPSEASGAYAGTPAYMAPEQHLGRAVTPASDQFGFCVTFWEAVFGQGPFSQVRAPELSTAPTLALAIIGNRLERVRGRHDVPRWLVAILLRGLSIDPDRRWPTVTALLAAVQRRLDGRRRGRALGFAGAGALAAGIAVAAGFGLGANRAPPVLPFATDRATRVTFAAGCEAQPALFPDGHGIVYAQRSGLSATLHVTGRDSARADALGAGGAPAVSPSGRYVAALDRTRVVVYDLEGAPGARPLGSSTSGPVWLNEREIIVGVDGALVARSLGGDGGDGRVLGHTPPGTVVRAVAVGSNGRVFTIYRSDASVAEAIVAEVLPSGATRDIRRGVLSTAGLRYRAASNTVYFVQPMNTTQLHLFAQPADGDVEPTPLVSDTPPTGGFDVAADGHRLVFSTCVDTASIVKLHRGGAGSEVTRRGAWRDSEPVAVDADRIVYASNRGGELQIWLRDPAAGEDRPLTAPESSYPAVSPDRKTLVYAAFARTGGNHHLIARPLGQDTENRTLTEGFVDRTPRFTADGAAVIFARETATGQRLYRVALGGGPASEVVPDVVRAFDVSPVADAIALVTRSAGRDRLQIASHGSAVHDAPGADALGPRLKFVRFARGGGTLAVVDGDSSIIELELATGHAHPVWHLDGSPYSSVGAIDYDLDQETIIAAVASADGDLWVADGRF